MPRSAAAHAAANPPLDASGLFPLGFLAAIVAAPGDDTPRLVLADWLEENTGVVPCPVCSDWGEDTFARNTAAGIHTGCSGTAPDGRAARAEFIRVQCELAKTPRMHVRLTSKPGAAITAHEGHSNERYDALRRREGAFLSDGNVAAWLPDLPDLEKMVRIRDLDAGTSHHAGWTNTNGVGGTFISANFRGGFVEFLTLSWEAWQSVHRDLVWWPGAVDVCPGCGGGEWKFCRCCRCGEVYQYTGKYSDCGNVACDGEKSDDAPCPQCSGQGTVPRPVRPTAQPVTSVVLATMPPPDEEFSASWQPTGYENVGHRCHTHPRWPTVKFTLPEVARPAP